jgi:hypothetical protein
MARPPPHSIAFPEHQGAKGMHFPAYTELLQQVSMTSNPEAGPQTSGAQPESGRRTSQSNVGHNLLPPPPSEDRARPSSSNGAPGPNSNSNMKTPNKLRPSQLSGPESASLMSSVTMMLPPTFGTPAHLLGNPPNNAMKAPAPAPPNAASNVDAKLNAMKSPVLGEILEDDDGQSVISDDFEDAPAPNSKRVKTGRTNSQSQVKGPAASSAKDKDKEKRKRQVQSCSECRRRKIKCDKKFPCGPCVLRNDQSICREVEKHNSSS